MKTLLTAVTAAACAALLTTSAHAAQSPGTYPIRPVRLIVPFAPGGGTDIVARTIAQKMSESLNQSVIVDNRPGAGGTVGAETAVRATPDGHTLILVSSSYATNAALYKLQYDPVADIDPIVMIGESGFVLTVHPSVPVKTVADLIAHAKANPGALNYGSSGTGGIMHLTTELFDLMAQTRMTHIPYKGTGPALSALVANQIQVAFGALPAAIPHVKANRLRGIAVTMEKSTPALPGVPPVGHTIKGYEVVLWYGVWGPKGLPKEVITTWNRDIAQALKTKEMQDRTAAEGIETAGGPPEQFRRAIQRDIEKWKRVVREAKISVQS